MLVQSLRRGQRQGHTFGIGGVIAALPLVLYGSPVSAHMAGSPQADDYDPIARTQGAWYAPPLPPLQDRMQAVHAALLPNGKVLIVNGSSNRNRLVGNAIHDGVDVTDYDTVNNTALFDPEAPPGQHGMTRIASPLPPDADGDATDLFCSGHVHLWNGNVLFVGGTRLYYAAESFRGHKNAMVFDWQQQAWHAAGKTRDGHWYPSLVTLADGRIVVFTGFAYDKVAISEWVEFYDPWQPLAHAWTAVHLGSIANGPFTTPVGSNPANLDGMHWYPHIFPLADGRLLFTHDGARLGNLGSQHTYIMSISPRNGAQPPQVSFSPGPQRQANSNKAYGGHRGGSEFRPRGYLAHWWTDGVFHAVLRHWRGQTVPGGDDTARQSPRRAPVAGPPPACLPRYAHRP